MSERFRRTLRGEVRSSEGFSVRLAGRSELTYSRGKQTWSLNAEMQAGPGISVVLHAKSVPVDGDRDRVAVVRDIERAFLAMGWDLQVIW